MHAVNKYIMKTFKEGKTITELGIDVTREFVVLKPSFIFNIGDILKFVRADDDNLIPLFKRVNDGTFDYIDLDKLAYATETFERGEQIAVSDISEEDAILSLESDSWKNYYTGGKIRSGEHIVEFGEMGSRCIFKYIAKIPKTPEVSEYTIQQLQEKLGEKFKLIK